MSERFTVLREEGPAVCPGSAVVFVVVLLLSGCAWPGPAPPATAPPTSPPPADARTAAPAVAPPSSPSVAPPVADPQPNVAAADPAPSSITPPTVAAAGGEGAAKAQLPAAKAPAKGPAKAPAPVTATAPPASAAGPQPANGPGGPQPAAKPKAPLDLASLEQRLKDTKAIGVLTKLTLKNQVDDLLDQFRAYYKGRAKTDLALLRRSYDSLVLKVISLLQDGDQALAAAVVASREAIWGILADPAKFATI
jgi:hypothetical protein